MKLYHTGRLEIRKPDIHHGRKNADFGWGLNKTKVTSEVTFFTDIEIKAEQK